MPWYRGIAPAYLNLFIWAPFFDQLWAGRQVQSGIPWLFVDAILGSLICFGLYLTAASWGLSARKPLLVVASSTFGATGAEWLCGVAVAIAGVALYAIGINFGVDATLLGLRTCGLIDESGLAAWRAGPFVLKSPVFLGTAFFWVYITRLAIMMRLSGVLVALMKVYAPIALLLLTATAIWGVSSTWAKAHAIASGASGVGSAPIQNYTGGSALTMMVSYFALSALLSVDWGAAVGGRRDILRAGLPCVLGAAAWTSIMSLVVVNNTAQWLGDGGPLAENSSVGPMPMSFRWALSQGRELYPPGASTAILVLFGLAAVAPAVSSLAKYSDGIGARWTALRPRWSTLIACPISLVLIVSFQVDHLGPIYRTMGALFAPVLGAMAGDLLGRNQARIVFRSGINPAGIVAWAAGCSVAAALEMTTPLQPDVIAALRPGSICGFLTSAIAYLVLSLFGSGAVPLFAAATAKDSAPGIAGSAE
jgi:cytosine permease